MSATPEPARDLVPAGQNQLSSLGNQFPEILSRAGPAAVFAAEEFFFGRIRNPHTRAAYLRAVRQFLDDLVTRHAMILNPALSVRGERYEAVEGKTPEITVAGARQLLASIDA